MDIKERLKKLLDKCIAKRYIIKEKVKYETLREHRDNLLKHAKTLKELGYISEYQYFLLKEACEYHDYGKMNKYFQDRIKNGGKFDWKKEIYHNLISLIFVDEEIFEDKADYYIVIYAIVNHHYYLDNINYLDKKGNRDKISSIYEEIVGIKKKIDIELIDELATIEALGLKSGILTGLLNKCDYAASGNYQVEYKNDFLLNKMNNLGYKWNKMQEYLIENRDNNVVVVANTGMGKTEGAFLWIGDTKGFFILPIRTAINAIYERTKNQILNGKTQNRLSLLHSEALDYLLENNDNGIYEDIKQEYSSGKNLF